MKINIPETDQERVVIVGGGFGGLTLARELKKQDYQIVLIDKNNYHQFQPLFYQVAMSGLEPSSIVFPFRKAFQGEKNMYVRVTEVERVDTQKKMLHTPLGICNYDYLVLAIGADTNFFGNEEIAKKALPMKSVSEALHLRNRILTDYEIALSVTDYEKRQQLIDIVIVGGGPTGVEVAGALAEMKRYVLPKDYPQLNTDEIDIHLVEGADRLLLGMSEKAGQKAKEFLEGLDVKVKLNAMVTGFDGERATLSDESTIPARKLIWAAGVTGNKMPGLPEDTLVKGNRIAVDRYNRVQGTQDIFAIGDIAFMEEPDYPKGHPQVAQAAMQHAKHLAKNFKKRSKDKEMEPFSYTDLGSMATIGRNRAVADLPGFKFQGAFAWLIWLFVHLFQILGAKNKVFIFVNWVWNYLTYDQSLRLIIRPKEGPADVARE
jgi:NADH dehydrogenase